MSEFEEVTLPAEGLVSSKVITKYLDISPSMWQKLLKAGRVKPATKIGTSSRWCVDYVRKLASEGISA